MKLRNRFAILVFIEDAGLSWAVNAIDNSNDSCWKPELYIDCYDSGFNN
jgi:hypothetical protein